MNPSPARIAEAFSRHRFDEVHDHLAEDVWWDLVGERRIEGRDAVIATCRESVAHQG